jgi:NADPH:quinone reductase-like Zn-dependent oxidoreductase
VGREFGTYGLEAFLEPRAISDAYKKKIEFHVDPSGFSLATSANFAVQLAKWKGAYVFATASTKNQDLLRQLGVDEPIDYTQQRFEHVARNIDIVLDTLGDETQERSWSVLKKGGNLVSLVQPPSEEKAEELGVRATFVAGHPSGAQLAEIAKMIDSGKLAPIIDRILPLSEARRAHELSQSGHVRGKIALRVKDQTS